MPSRLHAVLISLALVLAASGCGEKPSKPPTTDGGGSGGSPADGDGDSKEPEVEYVDRNKSGEIIGQSGLSRHDLDRQIIEQLVAAGSDVSKPHRIEHHFAIPNRSIALKVQEWAKANGYEHSDIIQERSDVSIYYYVDLFVETPLEIEAIAKHSRRMETLAATMDCEYDGWGCEVVP